MPDGITDRDFHPGLLHSEADTPSQQAGESLGTLHQFLKAVHRVLDPQLIGGVAASHEVSKDAAAHERIQGVGNLALTVTVAEEPASRLQHEHMRVLVVA